MIDIRSRKIIANVKGKEIPFEEYYAFDLVPTYWKELAKRLDTGRMILLDMVKDEIDKANIKGYLEIICD